ncbi:MAG: HTTM domain-containing protein [Bacteroidota bacterium]
MNSTLSSYGSKTTDAAPLALFRILFGLMMAISILRFYLNGWIEKLYLEPAFHFTYLGFEWVKPLGGFTYFIFLICGISALLVAAGFKYRFAIVSFFLSFTYIELMDKTTYLNHYYFVSVMSFLMIFLPAHKAYSVDAARNESIRFQFIPQWSEDAIKLMLFIVYFYAGLAKLNSDWMLEAMPLKIWLPSKYATPIIGDLLQESWVHYLFSWFGAIYDLSIGFLLWNKRTVWIGFFAVVVFHLMTALLFPIGMFPFIMILSTMIFLPVSFHNRILTFFSTAFRTKGQIFKNGKKYISKANWQSQGLKYVLLLFFVLQVLIPFRYLLYPGELFWTEEGFRFSWRVMLMEKAGYTAFVIEDPDKGHRFYVENSRFLTPFQEKQMSAQADFILEYAHFLEETYKAEGIRDPKVFVESYVALNGRRSRVFVDPKVDLTTIRRSLSARDWILPFEDEIKGL